ncbi:hypothetical protein GGI05_003092 [Coemansia sp. RSA 2603]|nr:hypothetical protein GGI05_003092 [Coemansia sp. RSA 2603]
MRKARKYRQLFRDTCRRHFADACVDLVAIEYHGDMHSLATANRRMAKATLPSIPWIRTMDNEVIGDILYYFSTFHGRAMLAMVIGKLNAAYKGFVEAHPGFKGPVSLVAHSLGGIVCYEILYCMHQLRTASTPFAGSIEAERYHDLPQLQFAPDRLFTLGSPLGGTLVFRNLAMDAFHMGSVGYHNIFHPFDPFGYRTEPLCDERFADEPAVPVTAPPVGHVRRASLGKNMRDVVLAPAALYAAVKARAGETHAHRRRSLLAPLLAPFGRHRVSRLLGLRSRSLDAGQQEAPEEPAETEEKAEPRRRTMDSTAPDDMLGQLVRIFGPSRQGGRAQQLAEAQGLPLASRLLAAVQGAPSVTRGGVELRPTNTVPLDVSGLLACPPALDTHDALPGAPVCAVHVSAHTVRRTRSLPDGRLLGSLLADSPRHAHSARCSTVPASPAPENAPRRLPYAERMDYIVPFTKRHLQNEYWLGFHAHFSYWSSKDVVYHILHHMINNPAAALK